MPRVPLWSIPVFLAYDALVVVGPCLLVAAAVVLAVPALRRSTRLRRAAYRMLAACLVLLVTALPVLGGELSRAVYAARVWAATRHLRAPQTVGGVRFPAGSTVQLSPEDGSLETGRVPAATLIAGLPLVGDFDLHNGSDFYLTGTLAIPSTVNGVPCGPGPLTYRKDEHTRCVLARDYAFQGHLLAGGQTAEIYRPSRSPGEAYFPDELKFGVLARPELLVDVAWPAGTIVGGITAPPSEMAHRSSGDVVFCLPAGRTAQMPGATLHGLIAYTARDDDHSVFAWCSLLPDHETDRRGYAQVGPERFDVGERPDSASSWHWSATPTPH